MHDMTTITLSGFKQDESRILSLFDVTGREVVKENFSGISVVLHRNGLQDGVYILGICNLKDNLRFTSKLVVCESK